MNFIHQHDWDNAVKAAIGDFEQPLNDKSPSPPALSSRSRKQKKVDQRPGCDISSSSLHPSAVAAVNKAELRLPQIIFDHCDDHGSLARCLDGSILFQLLAARIDKDAVPFQVYGKALCLWSEGRRQRQQQRNCEPGKVEINEMVDLEQEENTQSPVLSTISPAVEPVTLMLDVRSGNGWHNPKALHIIPFVCSMAQYAHEHNPGQIQKIVVYPVPHAARYLWEMVKPFLDKQIVQKLVIIPGSSERHAPPPNSKLRSYVNDVLLEKMEQTRLSLFCEPSITTS